MTQPTGLYRKFEVQRVNGENKPDQEFFVLSPTTDPLARVAIQSYITECHKDGQAELATDLEKALARVSANEPFYN